MLRGLRKASSNWLGKAVMAAVVGFLVISFAIWGIGDIFRGFGRSTVAKIGTHRDHHRAVPHCSTTTGCSNIRASSAARSAPIRPARMGLDRLVIGQLIAEIVLDERARALGLNLSDAEVAKQITADPAFQGPERPVRSLPLRADRSARPAITEPRYVAEQRRRLLRRELAGTIATGLTRAEGADRGGQPLSERAALDRIRAARPRAGRRNSAARRRRCWPSISKSARSCSARPNTASW